MTKPRNGLSYDEAQKLRTKDLLDEIVFLLNVLIQRHVRESQGPVENAPKWFVDELRAIDFTANTMQSAIDNPEDEDVSFAFKRYGQESSNA